MRLGIAAPRGTSLRSARTPVRIEDENVESRSMKMSEYLKSEHAEMACSESLSCVCSTYWTIAPRVQCFTRERGTHGHGLCTCSR